MSDSTLMTEAANPTPADASQPSTPAPAVEGQQQQGAAAPATEPAKPDATAPEAKPEEKPEAKAGAPEKYEFKAPEGKDFDADTLAAFSEVAKELDLPQESAQKVIDKLGTALAEKQMRVIDTAKGQWAEAVRADKEVGGAQFDANLAVAKKALDQFGTPELRALLNESGLGNHPEIIRAFYRAGKAISEDSFVGGTEGTAIPSKSYADSLYPNQSKH